MSLRVRPRTLSWRRFSRLNRIRLHHPRRSSLKRRPSSKTSTRRSNTTSRQTTPRWPATRSFSSTPRPSGAGRHCAQDPQPHLPDPLSGYVCPASSRPSSRPRCRCMRLGLLARRLLRLRLLHTQTAPRASFAVLRKRSWSRARARARTPETGLYSSRSSATTGAFSIWTRTAVALQPLNRHDRTWDRSGRVTAVLPNNAYYVSLDGSRRVTQRTRAHIKPIAIFPLHAGDVFSGRLRPGAPSDTPVVAEPRVVPVPVTADPSVGPEAPPLEPAHAQEVADGVPIKIERNVDGAQARPLSSSPVFRRRGRPRHPASVSQPAHRPPVAPQLAPPVGDVMPKRRRGRPRKRPAPEPLAESVLDTVAESASDAARQSSPPIRPSAPAEDPAWQPRIALRRIDDPHVGAEARTSKTSNADGHLPDQPEVARPCAVTRSGCVSRPPLWYGLGGDAAD